MSSPPSPLVSFEAKYSVTPSLSTKGESCRLLILTVGGSVSGVVHWSRNRCAVTSRVVESCVVAQSFRSPRWLV